MKQVSLAEKAFIIAMMAVSSGATAAILKLALGYAILMGIVGGVLAFCIIAALNWVRN